MCCHGSIFGIVVGGGCGRVDVHFYVGHDDELLLRQINRELNGIGFWDVVVLFNIDCCGVSNSLVVLGAQLGKAAAEIKAALHPNL